MSAPVRQQAASELPIVRPRDGAIEHWQTAALIRKEWLARGLATEPADRTTAERSLTRIYARLSRPRPRFVWVDSPRGALPHLAGLPTLDVLYQWVMPKLPGGAPPLASDLVAVVSRLRGGLDGGVVHADLDPPPGPRKRPEHWPVLPPLDALHSGVPLREVLRQGIREALFDSLARGVYLPVRAALAAGSPLPVCWYGQQESWVAHYDVLRRLGLARYPTADGDHLDDWVALADSCGWWWPGEGTCVVVERPAVIRTEPVPGGWHEQVRLCRGGQPPVRYRDGWSPPLT